MKKLILLLTFLASGLTSIQAMDHTPSQNGEDEQTANELAAGRALIGSLGFMGGAMGIAQAKHTYKPRTEKGKSVIQAIEKTQAIIKEFKKKIKDKNDPLIAAANWYSGMLDNEINHLAYAEQPVISDFPGPEDMGGFYEYLVDEILKRALCCLAIALNPTLLGEVVKGINEWKPLNPAPLDESVLDLPEKQYESCKMLIFSEEVLVETLGSTDQRVAKANLEHLKKIEQFRKYLWKLIVQTLDQNKHLIPALDNIVADYVVGDLDLLEKLPKPDVVKAEQMLLLEAPKS